MRLADFSYEEYQKALRQSAGAVVIILPKNMSAMPQDIVQVITDLIKVLCCVPFCPCECDLQIYSTRRRTNKATSSISKTWFEITESLLSIYKDNCKLICFGLNLFGLVCCSRASQQWKGKWCPNLVLFFKLFPSTLSSLVWLRNKEKGLEGELWQNPEFAVFLKPSQILNIISLKHSMTDFMSGFIRLFFLEKKQK